MYLCPRFSCGASIPKRRCQFVQESLPRARIRGPRGEPREKKKVYRVSRQLAFSILRSSRTCYGPPHHSCSMTAHYLNIGVHLCITIPCFMFSLFEQCVLLEIILTKLPMNKMHAIESHNNPQHLQKTSTIAQCPQVSRFDFKKSDCFSDICPKQWIGSTIISHL